MLNVVLGVSFAVVVDVRHFSSVKSCLEGFGSLHDRTSVPGADELLVGLLLRLCFDGQRLNADFRVEVF